MNAVRPWLLLFFLFVFLDTGSAQSPLPSPDLSLVGLYPTGKVIPSGKDVPWIFYVYESDPVSRVSDTSVALYPESLSLRDWELTWFVIDTKDQSEHLPGNIQGEPLPSPFRLRCYLRYNGAFQEDRKVLWSAAQNLFYPEKHCLLSEEQLDACRPEVLLLPASGVTVEPRDTRSLFSRWTGAEPPVRTPLDAAVPSNVLMLLIDTLRPDHTAAGGHPHVLTPHIDMLAALGASFPHAYGASSSTRPSIGTIFTGLQPRAHGAVRHATNGAALLSGIPRLPELFQENGYHTVGVSSNAQITRNFGFDRGFDAYECSVWENRVTPRGLYWLRNLDEPFFLYLHYLAPHQPYEPPSPYGEIYRGKNPHAEEDLYCGEISLEDHRVGAILAELSRQGLLNRTLIWLLSDHGEEFWEHGWNGHGAKLFEETVRTLSVMTYPRLVPMGMKVETPVVHADVLPTLADLLGWTLSSPVQGKSLLPLLKGQTPEWAGRAVFLHHGGGAVSAPHESDKQAVLLGSKKLIWWDQKDTYELYDLQSDVAEQHDQVALNHEAPAVLEALLKGHLAECEAIAKKYIQPDDMLETPPLSPVDEENLRHGLYIE